MPIVNISNVHGGESLSDLSNGNNAILLENVDIFSGSNFVQVAKKPHQIFNGEEVTHILDVYGVGDNPILFFTKSGKVYKEGETDPVFEFYPDAAREDSYPIFRMVHYTNTRVFFIAPRLYVSGESSYSQDTLSSIHDAIYSFSPTTFVENTFDRKNFEYQYRFFYSSIKSTHQLGIGGDVFIGVGRLIYKIGLATGVILEAGVANNDIVGIEQSGSYFTVYDERGNVYDWTPSLNTGFDGSGDLIVLGLNKKSANYYNLGLRPISVGNILGTNYIINEKGISLNQGPTQIPILEDYDSQYISDKYNFEYIFNNNAPKNTNNIMLCKLKNNLAYFGLAQGQQSPSFVRFDNDSKYERILTVSTSRHGFYISYQKEDDSYAIDFLDTRRKSEANKYDSMIIITGEFYAGGILSRKGQRLLQLYAENVSETNNIKIYHSINGQEFELIKNVTKTVRGRFEIPYANREFHKIVFKFECYGDVKLYDLLLNYD